MQFTRLWPLAFLAAVPILILIYMLKKQNQPKEVSSVFLWQEVIDQNESDKPWQKLRSHLLLLLEILAVLLLVLALMAPGLVFSGSAYKNVIFIVDNSASMNAVCQTDTRLEAAKKWIAHYIKHQSSETKGYVIRAGMKPQMILTGTSDQKVLLKAVRRIQPGYGKDSIDEAVQMAKTFIRSVKEPCEIVVLTDKAYQDQQEDLHMVYFGETGLNGAITLMAHQRNQTKMTVLMQVQNKGKGVYTADASLYDGEKLLDVQEVSLNEGESTTLHFELTDQDPLYLKGELSTKDDLEADNTYYYIPDQTMRRKVLLVTDENIFLEKALMVLKDCEIYKTSDTEMLKEDDSYDLYVLDRQKTDQLPLRGNLLLIDCENDSLDLKADEKGSRVIKAVNDNLPDYLKDLEFTAGSCKAYKLPYWGKSILQTGPETTGFMGEKNGQKIGVLGFDPGSSDFVLKAEFPLFIYYLGGELLNTSVLEKSNFTTLETIKLHQSSSQEETEVTMPSGRKINLTTDCLEPLDERGIYEISMGKTGKLMAAVNYPSAEESDLSQRVTKEKLPSKSSQPLKKSKCLTPYLILLALSVVLTEWYFYRKGY